MMQLIMQRPDAVLMQRPDMVERPGVFLAIISLFLVLFALVLLFRNY